MLSGPYVNRIAEYHGFQAYPEAVERVLSDNSVDVVLVKNIVPEPMLAALAQNNDVACYDVELPDVQGLLGSFWEKHGYKDYEIQENPYDIPEVRKGGVGAHVDWVTHAKELLGPLTVSLGLTGEADFYCQKPPKSFKNPVSGLYSPKASDHWRSHADQLKAAGTRPQSVVRQEAGDAVLISNHPRPAWHKVEATYGRVALLYDARVTLK